MVTSPPMRTRTPSAFQSIVARFPQDETDAGSSKTAGRSAASAPCHSPVSQLVTAPCHSVSQLGRHVMAVGIGGARADFLKQPPLQQFLQIALEGPAVNAG